MQCNFYTSAHRSKYLDFLDPGIVRCQRGEFPKNIDIFICDWRADNFTDSLPKKLAKTWVGIRRLGKMKAAFPDYYHVIAIEPGVEGDICIWPIISTWPDELTSKRKLKSVLGIKEDKGIGLLCENGAYAKHILRVFRHRLPKDVLKFRLSNSPFSEKDRDISYYPAARLFRAADYLVIGGGYNSFHEALSYANMSKTTIINVGGDDQALRIKNSEKWERRKGSQAHVLAKHIVDYHLKNNRRSF